MNNFTVGSLNEISRTITDYTNNGKCSECGACCTNFLPISRAEKMRIRDFVHKNKIKEQRLIFPSTQPVYDIVCPFLSRSKETQKCLIYPVRPLICHRFCCNQPLDLIEEQKTVLIKKNGMTDMRKEFFGNSIVD